MNNIDLNGEIETIKHIPPTSKIKETEDKSEIEQLFINDEEEAYKLKGTPMTIVRHKDDWGVLIGKYRLSEKFEHFGEALDDAKRQDWERVMQIIQLMIEQHDLNKWKPSEEEENKLTTKN